MNNKAELGVGSLIVVAMAVILGLIIFQAIATNIEAGTRTITGNKSIQMTTQLTAPAVGTVVELTGQELINTPTVKNSTGGTVIGTANYSIYECVRPSTNLKGICYKSLVAPTTVDYGPTVNYSYGYYEEGYIDDAGARGISSIILVLAGIAIVMVALYPTLKNQGMFG